MCASEVSQCCTFLSFSFNELREFFFFVCVMFCLPDQLDQLQKKCGRVITAEEEKKDRDNGERGKHTHTHECKPWKRERGKEEESWEFWEQKRQEIN